MTSAAVVAAVAIVAWAASDDKPGRAAPGKASPTAVDQPASDRLANDRTPRLGLTPDAVTVEVPSGSYVTRYDGDARIYPKPMPFEGDVLTTRSSDPDVGGQVAILVVDDEKNVEDVMVLGNLVTQSQVGKLQWLMSKDGVELAWDTAGLSDWSVDRNGTSVTTDGAGHYFDRVPFSEVTRYAVHHDGRAVTGDGPITYVALMPLYDGSMIGQPIDSIGQTTSPGMVSQSPAAGAKPTTSTPSPPAASPTATTPRTKPRYATIHSGRASACDAILAVNTTPVPDEAAEADNRYFGEQLLGEGASGNVRNVGLSSCGDLPVIAVGMKISTARLPAYGPGGTPVMAYRQREIVAF